MYPGNDAGLLPIISVVFDRLQHTMAKLDRELVMYDRVMLEWTPPTIPSPEGT
jgi:hypothetical protein